MVTQGIFPNMNLACAYFCNLNDSQRFFEARSSTNIAVCVPQDFYRGSEHDSMGMSKLSRLSNPTCVADIVAMRYAIIS